jgi:acetyl esterase/lipase
LHRNPGLVMRPDYEVPVAAVVDYLVTRTDVDADRLAIVGYSAGGYLAPRAAAFDPRLKACIANGLIHDVYKYFLLNWPEEMRAASPQDFGRYYRKLAAEYPAIEWAASHAEWSFGIASPEDFLSAWVPYNLNDVRDRMTFPLLAIEGEVVPEMMEDGGEYGHALRQEVEAFFAALPSTDKTAVYSTWLDGGALHCQMPGQSTARAYMLDWLQSRIGDPAPAGAAA